MPTAALRWALVLAAATAVATLLGVAPAAAQECSDDSQCDDGVFCNGAEQCGETEECEAGTPPNCDDGATCTVDTCDEEADRCVNTPQDSACNDNDVCTTDTCDPSDPGADQATGCVNVADIRNDSLCRRFVCRTGGFWSTHADSENSDKGGQNITQRLLDFGGPLNICGVEVNNTALGQPMSALEALCVIPAGSQRLQLARQLTTLALNCIMSGQGSDCSTSLPDLRSLFDTCNQLCATDNPNLGTCISMIDCVNNGGDPFLVPGACIVGNCSIENQRPCSRDADCPVVDSTPQTCVPSPSCHDQTLIFDREPDGNPELNFEPPGPASSPKLCNDARTNDCTLLSCP